MNPPSLSEPTVDLPPWIDLVRAQLDHVRFGLIQLVIHDGRVTQIETTEKVRIAATRD